MYKIYPSESERLSQYSYYQKLLEGKHYQAFSVKAEKEFTERYSMLRYVQANFAGLISKVIADLLFVEEISIQSDGNQEWLEALYHESSLKTQNWESALSNSALGDAVYKIRVIDGEVRIEDIDPSTYFPQVVEKRQTPTKQTLAWILEDEDEVKYLVEETHMPQMIITMAYNLDKDGKKEAKIDINTINKRFGTNYVEKVKTGIDELLLVHVPNYRNKKGFWGTSDYADLTSLFFAVNNRLTKVDNILDKHSDPILALPTGILDEDGKVRKEALGMIEKGEDGTVPEYIVWNANLDSAFNEIDHLIELLFMTSETSPDAIGKSSGGGLAESGRALKMRLIRTIAKKKRKELYYSQGLKQVFYIAQKLAKANGYTVNGMKITEEPTVPEIIFSDGIVNDDREIAETEALKIDAGLSDQMRSIMKIEGVTEQQAIDIINNSNNATTEQATY